MFRNKSFHVFVLICSFLSASVLMASDAALVTEKAGDVSATLEGETWQVELADLLPDGVEIKVAADGSLVIVHLQTNHEYRFGPAAEAQISLAGVSGENLASAALELVTADIALSNEMTNQTGAVNPERVSVFAPSAQPEQQAPRKTLAPAMRMQKASDEEFPGAMDKERVEFDSAGIAARSELFEDSGSAPAVGLKLALPVVAFAKICTDESLLAVKGDGISGKSLNYVDTEWVEIQLYHVASAPEKVTLSGDGQSLDVAVTASDAPPTITAAWKLEKSGFLYQAAAMWLSLRQAGLPAAKVAPHLKRLADKISALSR